MAAIVRHHETLATPIDRQAAPARVRTILRVGFWSAVVTAIFYIGWLIGMAFSFFLPSPWNEYAPMAPSLFIPFGWVPLMISIRDWAAEEKRIFADIAVAFGAMYGALLTMNYFVALTVTLPKASAGTEVGILAIQPQSVFLAVEIVGYTLMSLSALFAAFVFTGQGLKRWIRWLLVITGVFGLGLFSQMLSSSWPSAASIALLPREFTLPAAVILLALLFRRGEQPSDASNAPLGSDD